MHLDCLGADLGNLSKNSRSSVFCPSVTRMVMKTQTRQLLVQEPGAGKKMLVTGTPIFDRDGRLRRVISYSHGITELHDLKAYIEDMEQQKIRVRSELEQMFP